MKDKKQLISNLTEALYLAVMFLFMLLVKSTYSVATNYDFLMFLFFAFAILAILTLIGPKFNRIFGFIFGSLISLYFVSQAVYERAFGQYYRFSTALGLKNETAGVTDAINELLIASDFIPFVALLVITVVFIGLYFVFQRKNINKKGRLLAIPFLVIALISFFVNSSQINNGKNGYTDFDIYKSDYYIYNNLNNTNQFVNKFGLMNLLYRDAVLTFGGNNVDENVIQTIDDYFNSKTYRSDNNKMTGVFKDKSLLIIQAESLVNLGISEEFTPNLYYLMNSGINVKNFNSPLLIGSTSDTEFMANTSFLPMSDGYPVCYDFVNNAFPLTLGNIYRNNGYLTTAYHNNYAEYYNRSITFDKYGYDFYDSYRLAVENLTPDSRLAESIGWILSERDKFMSYWVSYSGHQPYNLDTVAVDKTDVDTIKAKYPNLNDEYVSYIAKAIDLDRAVANFINVMDWQGRLNDVVIVIFGDHVCKGIDFSKGSNYDLVFGKNSDENPEIMQTPFFIWANNIEHIEYEKSSTGLDILPTLCNMWGFDVDLTYAFGNDVFDDNYKGFYFDAKGNYITNDFSYNIVDDKLDIKGSYSESQALEQIKNFNQMKDIANMILKIDYFKESE